MENNVFQQKIDESLKTVEGTVVESLQQALVDRYYNEALSKASKTMLDSAVLALGILKKADDADLESLLAPVDSRLEGVSPKEKPKRVYIFDEKLIELETNIRGAVKNINDMISKANCQKDWDAIVKKSKALDELLNKIPKKGKK